MVAVEVLLLMVIATGLWLWMARANKGGRAWARITATVFFGVLTACELAGLISSLEGSGIRSAYNVLLLVFFVVYWLAGLSAVALLWQRSSSDYYDAVGKRSKGIR